MPKLIDEFFIILFLRRGREDPIEKDRLGFLSHDVGEEKSKVFGRNIRAAEKSDRVVIETEDLEPRRKVRRSMQFLSQSKEHGIRHGRLDAVVNRTVADTDKQSDPEHPEKLEELLGLFMTLVLLMICHGQFLHGWVIGRFES